MGISALEPSYSTVQVVVATVLWEPDFEWIGQDVEAAYIFKMVAIGLVVFFLIAISFGLI